MKLASWRKRRRARKSQESPLDLTGLARVAEIGAQGGLRSESSSDGHLCIPNSFHLAPICNCSYSVHSATQVDLAAQPEKTNRQARHVFKEAVCWPVFYRAQGSFEPSDGSDIDTLYTGKVLSAWLKF